MELIAVIGLGYVGLPLAVNIAKHNKKVIGFDISKSRVEQLKNGVDHTGEVEPDMLAQDSIVITDDIADIATATTFIVTVPTPITDANQPDLSALESACNTIGPFLKKGDLVVFESTVYPGVTEDVCGPILAAKSGLTLFEDIHLGYSPERINPGDKVYTVENIVKVISGSSPEILDRVEAIYKPVIKAGLFRCSSIKVAETAKVMENTQRDVNIALMNELSLICSRVGISTHEVLEAAGSKWNFLPFTPGLVGGHCIGVDPYYLAHLAEKVGLNPQVILAGRRLNDAMPGRVAVALMKLLGQSDQSIRNSRVGVFGIAFKENVPDIRNSKVVDVVRHLREYGLKPMVTDYLVQPEHAAMEGIDLLPDSDLQDLDLLIIGTPHKDYIKDAALLSRLKKGGIIADIRGGLRNVEMPEGSVYWSL
jgi:UDP-N-acetyl-D-galactosamine dehydrogenase